MPHIAKRFVWMVVVVAVGVGAAGWAVVRYGRDVLWPSGMLPGDVVRENEAVVCFRREMHGAYPAIVARVTTLYCLSSSCTERFVQQAHIDVHEQGRVILVTSKFIYRDTRVNGVQCTADCSGGGVVTVPLGDILPARYTVWIGDRRAGEIDVPSTQNPWIGDSCVSSRTQEDSKRASPTSSPAPYPSLFTPEVRAYP